MDALYKAIVVLHFLGLASLLGGWLVQLRASPRTISPAMLHGALTQLVTGLALVGLAETALADEEHVDYAKVGVKLVIVLVVLALSWVNRRRAAVPTGLWFGIGSLAIANVVIAVFA